MFMIEKQPENDKLYTVVCHFTVADTNLNQFLYHCRDLNVSDAARFVLYKKYNDCTEFPLVDEDSADYIETIFRLTNVKRVFVNDTGKVSAVQQT